MLKLYSKVSKKDIFNSILMKTIWLKNLYLYPQKIIISMRKTVLSFLMFSFISVFCFSQKKVFFKSTVIEEEIEEPVAEAIVTIEERKISTKTDKKGYFFFDEALDEGSYVVSIKKEGYESKVFLVAVKEGVKIKLEDTIYLQITKKEEKRRKDEAKDQEKELKEKMKLLEKEEKILAKQKKDLEKKNSIDVEYVAPEEKVAEEEEKVEVITENQKKYAELLGVNVINLTNKDLYDFVDNWIGTPYLMGGETKKAIDCSSFSQRLYISAYDKMYLERTAQKQYDSDFTELFGSKKYLSEGDLIFFGKDQFNITHVGVYLHNDKFVHSTSSTVDGPSGVKISSLSNPHWANLFISAGRRIINN